MTTLATSQGRTTRRRRWAIVAVSVLVSGPAVALLSSSPAQAASPILLGTSGSFAVLAGSGITNTGPTSIAGDVGTFETTTVTGFDSVTLDGVNHGGDAVTQQAKDDLTTAYDQAAASGPPNAVATELGGTTLTPGVYRSDTLGITGTLTLDTQGDPYAVFVFQAASTLTTATDSAVVILGGGEACNIFWQVGSSATLGTRAHLVGTVLAATSITATTGATVEGRLLASAGAVTLDTNTLTRSVCTTAATTTTTTGTGGSTTIPGGGATVPPGDTPGAAAPTATETATATGTGTPTGADVPPGGGVPLLPYTGVDSGDLAVLGVVLLGIGASALHVSRRRHRPLHFIQ